MTLKDHGKFGPKFNPAFQISSPEIGQFVSSPQTGPSKAINPFFFLFAELEIKIHFCTNFSWPLSITK